MRSFFCTPSLYLTLATMLLTVACASDTTTDDDDGSSGQGAGPSSSSSSTQTSGTGGTSAGSGGQGGGATGECPTATLQGPLPITYSGDTTGAPNIVRSDRLEWDWSAQTPPTTDGDHALLFVAPETATYVLDMTTSPGTLEGCGTSISEAGGTIYDSSWCPAPGMTKEIDGFYAAFPGTPATVDLTQGQELLIWVGCASWETEREGAYSITLSKQ